MKTHDFITSVIPLLGDKEAKTKKCASVMFDAGVLYSYGTHYPLLFKLPLFDNPAFTDSIIIRNTRGYLNTTAKHISWAGGFNHHDVELVGDDISKENVIDSLCTQINLLQYEIDGCSPRPTKKRFNLENQIEDARYTLSLLDSDNPLSTNPPKHEKPTM